MAREFRKLFKYKPGVMEDYLHYTRPDASASVFLGQADNSSVRVGIRFHDKDNLKQSRDVSFLLNYAEAEELALTLADYVMQVRRGEM